MHLTGQFIYIYLYLKILQKNIICTNSNNFLSLNVHDFVFCDPILNWE